MTSSVGYSGRSARKGDNVVLGGKSMLKPLLAHSNFYPGSRLNPFDRRLSVGGTGAQQRAKF